MGSCSLRSNPDHRAMMTATGFSHKISAEAACNKIQMLPCLRPFFNLNHSDPDLPRKTLLQHLKADRSTVLQNNAYCPSISMFNDC